MQLSPQLGSVILSDLRKKFPEIPKVGVLAGGAVADWFFGLEPNDLDVFVQADKSHFAKRFYGVKTSQYGTPECLFDNYERTLCIAWKHLCRVITSRRDGMLNIVACEGENITAAKVISGFDLNATRVAIDLDTERLVWDESFALFLKNSQLKITALFTPAHTAIRYFLKKKRLSCLGNDELEMQIVSNAWMENRIGNKSYELPVNFGKAYLEKANQAMTCGLSRFFEIQEEGKFWTLKPHQNFHFDTKHLDHVMYPVHAPSAFRSQAIDFTEAYMNKWKFAAATASNPDIIKMLQLFNGAYIRGQLTERIIKTVSSFLNYRPGFYPLLLGLNLERQAQVVRRLFRFAKRNGQWIYAMAQSEATQLDVISDDALAAFVLKFEPIFGKNQVAKNVAAPKKFLWYEINQLVSLKEISTEHEKLKLPMLSYDGLTKNSKYLISIQSKFLNTDRSISQIGPVFYGLPFMVHKNQSGRGRKTSLGCSLAAFWYCSYFNGNSLLERLANFTKSVKNYSTNVYSNKIFLKVNPAR
jgi:hypothetical protein